MKNSRLILSALLLVLGTSCGVFRSPAWYARHPLANVQRLVEPASGREVVVIPMSHLGSEVGYGTIRTLLDTLKAEGYVTFGEAVLAVPFHVDTVHEMRFADVRRLSNGELSSADSARLDTLLRKARRMIGMLPGVGGYADPQNGSLPKRYNQKGYVSQTDSLLGIYTSQDFWVDYSLADLVERTEQDEGQIRLSEYDFRTGFYEPYSPPDKAPSRQTGAFMLYLRNDYLVRRIAASDRRSIAVVYGATHRYGVIHQLCKYHGFLPDRRYRAEKQIQ